MRKETFVAEFDRNYSGGKRSNHKSHPWAVGDPNIFGKALQAIYIASHRAKQTANGQSATATINAKAIKPALVLAAALVASVRCDRPSIADSQNVLLRVSKSADRNKLFHRKRVLEVITMWCNRLGTTLYSIHSDYSPLIVTYASGIKFQHKYRYTIYRRLSGERRHCSNQNPNLRFADYAD
jgi:hypothetical protein